MKKTLSAILVLSAVVLSGCHDEETQIKLQQAEQLKTDLAQAQDELTKVRSEIPALWVKPLEIFNRSEEFKRMDPKPQDFVTESTASVKVILVDTGIQWLNELIYNKIATDYFNTANHADKQKIEEIQDPKARLQAIFARQFESARKSAETFENRANDYSQIMRYIGQRQNIVTFEQVTFVDGGGAHPMGWTNYINIDTDKKTVINLTSAFGNENLAKVKDALWGAYKLYNAKNGIHNETDYFVSKEEFEVSADFHFGTQGITFSYTPYAIGSYAEGEIQLLLPWSAARQWLKPEYVW
ncbi:RsiV family protein [Actinobacillus succinogenes]|nr:RsiV family protein [Actinobacillus succinogenes]